MGQIVIPGNLFDSAENSEEEVRLMLAIFLYKELKVPPGKAAQFAGLTRIEFWEELGKRKIERNYDVEDFAHDVESIKRFKSENNNPS